MWLEAPESITQDEGFMEMGHYVHECANVVEKVDTAQLKMKIGS